MEVRLGKGGRLQEKFVEPVSSDWLMVRVHQVIPSYTLGYILVCPTPLIRVDKIERENNAKSKRMYACY
jgi:hypothetical protein